MFPLTVQQTAGGLAEEVSNKDQGAGLCYGQTQVTEFI